MLLRYICGFYLSFLCYQARISDYPLCFCFLNALSSAQHCSSVTFGNRSLPRFSLRENADVHFRLQWSHFASQNAWSSPRAISTGQLHTLLHFHLRPIKQVVCLCPYQPNAVGNLILKGASRLDAFSVYPVRT